MAVDATQKLGALPPTGWDFVESGGAGYVLLTAIAAG